MLPPLGMWGTASRAAGDRSGRSSASDDRRAAPQRFTGAGRPESRSDGRRSGADDGTRASGSEPPRRSYGSTGAAGYGSARRPADDGIGRVRSPRGAAAGPADTGGGRRSGGRSDRATSAPQANSSPRAGATDKRVRSADARGAGPQAGASRGAPPREGGRDAPQVRAQAGYGAPGRPRRRDGAGDGERAPQRDRVADRREGTASPRAPAGERSVPVAKSDKVSSVRRSHGREAAAGPILTPT